MPSVDGESSMASLLIINLRITILGINTHAILMECRKGGGGGGGGNPNHYSTPFTFPQFKTSFSIDR